MNYSQPQNPNYGGYNTALSPPHPYEQHQSQQLHPPLQSQYSQPAMPPIDNQIRPDTLDDRSQRALATFGSPYAHNNDWAATLEDATLHSLPKQAFLMRVQQRFARTAGDIFNPPVPSFQRPPSNRWTYQPFSPVSISANSKLLADGFKPIYPGHILADHDVSAADWARFLEDMQVAGRLSGGQSLISNIAPLTMHLGATGYFVTKAIEKNMKKKKVPIFAETVEIWMQKFFVLRRLDVYIVDGNERITARWPGETVPGTSITAEPAFDDQSSDGNEINEDSSDSSDGEGDSKSSLKNGPNAEQLTSKQLRKQQKRERKANKQILKQERKADSAETKQKKKAAKHSATSIVIAPLE